MAAIMGRTEMLVCGVQRRQLLSLADRSILLRYKGIKGFVATEDRRISHSREVILPPNHPPP